MGYTHYYYKGEPTHNAAKFVAFVEDVKKVLALVKARGIEIAGGDGEGTANLTKDVVCFNGKDDLSHETFIIERNGGQDFNFCKTARKPYDLAVVAVLTLYKKHFPKVKFSSDGSAEELAEGVTLAGEAIGEKAEVFDNAKGETRLRFVFSPQESAAETPAVI